MRLTGWAGHLPFGSSAVASPTVAIAQLGERQTEDLKVPGSIPGVGSLGGACLHCVVISAVESAWCHLLSRGLCLARWDFHALKILFARRNFSLCVRFVCVCVVGAGVLLIQEQQQRSPTHRNHQRPCGPMDNASARGAGDCRFEPCRGHVR